MPALDQCANLYSEEFHAQSQLTAAESFLSSHPGDVALLTIDIGSNDLQHCVSSTQVNMSCLRVSDLAMEKNLAKIVRPLRSLLSRMDPSARMISMNYYDPFLGLAYSPGGAKGEKLALESLPAIELFNTELAATYRVYGVPTADVAASFRITATLPLSRYGGNLLPSDVVSACRADLDVPNSIGHECGRPPERCGLSRYLDGTRKNARRIIRGDGSSFALDQSRPWSERDAGPLRRSRLRVRPASVGGARTFVPRPSAPSSQEFIVMWHRRNRPFTPACHHGSVRDDKSERWRSRDDRQLRLVLGGAARDVLITPRLFGPRELARALHPSVMAVNENDPIGEVCGLRCD